MNQLNINWLLYEELHLRKTHPRYFFQILRHTQDPWISLYSVPTIYIHNKTAIIAFLPAQVNKPPTKNLTLRNESDMIK